MRSEGIRALGVHMWGSEDNSVMWGVRALGVHSWRSEDSPVMWSQGFRCAHVEVQGKLCGAGCGDQGFGCAHVGVRGQLCDVGIRASGVHTWGSEGIRGAVVHSSVSQDSSLQLVFFLHLPLCGIQD